ncbi:MAG: divergent PAP2 family protein [candidate division Zixibacteria bacterium]|nr:divergent PAP2 family protein [candidate division Zixibacteria bacterium]NIS46110.1 divergent PAP2 family protein [candidate division Zixibacteria bacterium]NIU12527.1 divergent PAP2 family protein [candidate division Zixibacteria bacterium]NIV04696.1 divergent PAP2 family protein [candidate division Zixibacteria bacterium]NIW43310.1 divergent PAP2 family protein [Gammaproteobacteria bacterium]
MDQTIFQSPVFVAAIISWFLAQALKVPTGYLRTKEVNWASLLNPGGMPSSHSSIITATTYGIGLYVGFDSPLFALAFAVASVVIYDATGIRRQAGIHAEFINAIIRELASGKRLEEWEQKKLQEVLGHTPMEAFAGTVLGIVVAQIIWFIW